MTRRKYDHCSFCGCRYDDDGWPRTCGHCGETLWRNPVPVGVVLQPVGEGFLAVRRNVGADPGFGKLALPGGFVDPSEGLREAAARELFEETGIRTHPLTLDFFDEVNVREPDLILSFWLAPAVAEDKCPRIPPTAEVGELVVLREPTELAFSTHTEMLARALRR